MEIIQMVLLYQDPHGNSITETTITHSMKEPGIKLNNFPSQVSRSGSDGRKLSLTQFLQEADISKKF